MNEQSQWNIPDSINDIDGYKFLEKTPSGGDAYYNAEQDKAMVVYRMYANVYFNRTKGRKGQYACCFSDCTRVENIN